MCRKEGWAKIAGLDDHCQSLPTEIISSIFWSQILVDYQSE